MGIWGPQNGGALFSLDTGYALEASEIGEIQAPVANKHRVLLRPELHQVKDLLVNFWKILVTSPSGLCLQWCVKVL